ncbi:conserved hypothetical protein [Hyphomicrobium sp. GJ21]|uniref:DUF7146 domain-containing protein n=1 Tax=Hyphomicrobium sp. GJ21 TaxID=113574 RepID=UPI00041832BA|nr:toprim domain-containing protein [Hyphomicrobium sp. GJ21]CEJ88083.1 conserved hypothetical protein [Hyphomicrobium sp. GJ21]
MANDIHALSQRLSQHVEAVCAHYLSNGSKNGRYWIVGDVLNTPGRSMWVRLTGPASGAGAAGKWTDAATGQHGDLIDLIALNRNLSDFRDIRDEVLTFLSEPRHLAVRSLVPAPRNSPEAAKRLFASATPIRGTLAEAYLRARGITAVDFPSLRFHPACFYRGPEHGELQRLPALLAAITSNDGEHTGLTRIYLSSDGRGKAPVSEPKLAMGHILGNGVRFGAVGDSLVIGEGVETVLSIKGLLPHLGMIAATAAAHLGAFSLPPRLKRLYIAMEDNLAGRAAAERLTFGALHAGIRVGFLLSRLDDWNSDLQAFGATETRAALLSQLLDPEDLPPTA